MDKATLRAAGHTLRQLREHTYGLTLEDVQKRTEEKFGEDRVLEATLSRIERGNISKPPSMLDMAELGLLYNLSPSRLFELYGLPTAGDVEGLAEPPEVTRLRITLHQLRDDEVATKDLLSMIDFACTRALSRKAR